MHSITMNHGATPGADHPRSAPRHKIFEPTRLISAAGETRAHMINVSRSGALVHAAVALRRGESVQLAIGSVFVAGQVRWVSGSRFGMAFSALLDAHVLDRLIGVQTE